MTGGNALAVTWRGVTDVIASTAANTASVSGSDVFTDGRLAHVQKGFGETLLAAGTRLAVSGRDYASVTGSPATVSVSGNRVQATATNDTNTYRVFAPQQIASVTINDVAVDSCRDGDYIMFPLAACTVATTLHLDAPTSASAAEPLDVSATLLVDGAPVADQVVALSLAGTETHATTDAGGVARATIPLDVDAGDHVLTAEFSPAGTLRGSTVTTTVHVVPAATTLSYTGEAQARGDTVAVSAILTVGGDALADQPVTFTSESSIATAITDATGRASTTLNVPDHGHSRRVAADYGGTNRYAPSSTSATVRWGLAG